MILATTEVGRLPGWPSIHNVVRLLTASRGGQGRHLIRFSHSTAGRPESSSLIPRCKLTQRLWSRSQRGLQFCALKDPWTRAATAAATLRGLAHMLHGRVPRCPHARPHGGGTPVGKATHRVALSSRAAKMAGTHLPAAAAASHPVDAAKEPQTQVVDGLHAVASRYKVGGRVALEGLCTTRPDSDHQVPPPDVVLWMRCAPTQAAVLSMPLTEPRSCRYLPWVGGCGMRGGAAPCCNCRVTAAPLPCHPHHGVRACDSVSPVCSTQAYPAIPHPALRRCPLLPTPWVAS